MRSALRDLFDEDWVVVLACGIGIAYTALNLAQAIGVTVAGAFETAETSPFVDDNGALAFSVGSHIVDLSQVVSSLIAFVLVVVAAAFVIARVRTREDGSKPGR